MSDEKPRRDRNDVNDSHSAYVSCRIDLARTSLHNVRLQVSRRVGRSPLEENGETHGENTRGSHNN
jgi:hypothetical protein